MNPRESFLRRFIGRPIDAGVNADWYAADQAAMRSELASIEGRSTVRNVATNAPSVDVAPIDPALYAMSEREERRAGHIMRRASRQGDL